VPDDVGEQPCPVRRPGRVTTARLVDAQSDHEHADRDPDPGSMLERDLEVQDVLLRRAPLHLVEVAIAR
jgi:hypothetical protein